MTMNPKRGVAGEGLPALPTVDRRRRAATRVSAASLVKTGFLPEAPGFPLLIEPLTQDIDAAAWARHERGWIEEHLTATGAILFRGFALPDAAAFRDFAGALSGEGLLTYTERAAPRREIAPQVYTSTEFAPDEPIPLHHEMSYSHNWPARLWFYCEVAPARGGATPLAAERELTRRIAPEVAACFAHKGILYIRNYGEGVDMSWQEAFQTCDRAVVEAYCRRCAMGFEWRDSDRLRTRAIRQVFAVHPKTGERLWFNHAAIFHETNLAPEVRAALRAQFAPEEMPRNAFHADGSPIDVRHLEHLRAVTHEAAVRFPWQRGDLLMVDNYLALHGRDPFAGPRSILVAMAELCTASGYVETTGDTVDG